MNLRTFGSVKKYRTLKYLTEKIGQMDENPRTYISTFIRNFNTAVRKTEQIQDFDFRKYILELIYTDYMSRVDEHIASKYEDGVTSRLRNFIHAKIRNAQNSINVKPKVTINYFKPVSPDWLLKTYENLRDPDERRDKDCSPLHDGIMGAIASNIKEHAPTSFLTVWTCSMFPERLTKEVLRLVEQQIILIEK